jgi:chloramphenicol 3-O phosphotransferase
MPLGKRLFQSQNVFGQANNSLSARKIFRDSCTLLKTQKERKMNQRVILLLNGTSSAGKSSISKSLQRILDTPYLHVCIDTFEEMIPQRDWAQGEFKRTFCNALSGFHYSIAALASRGSDLIVDHVIVEGSSPANWLVECLEQVAPHRVFFIGVHCPLEELERREKIRGDRNPGLAHWQFSRVHLHGIYDIEVDTSLASPDECAMQIKTAMENQPHPDAVQRLLAILHA